MLRSTPPGPRWISVFRSSVRPRGPVTLMSRSKDWAATEAGARQTSRPAILKRSQLFLFTAMTPFGPEPKIRWASIASLPDLVVRIDLGDELCLDCDPTRAGFWHPLPFLRRSVRRLHRTRSCWQHERSRPLVAADQLNRAPNPSGVQEVAKPVELIGFGAQQKRGLQAGPS